MHRYWIVLFCNRRQQKVMHRLESLKAARAEYNKIISEVKPPFHVETKNKRRVEYFVGLVGNEEKTKRVAHTRDYMGRSITMEVADHQSLLDVDRTWVEEKIYDNHRKTHVTFDALLTHLDALPGLKMIYKLNSHLFVENEDFVGFYSLKNIDDCERLIAVLMRERIKDGKTDCLYSRDGDRAHRKYLYEHLRKFGYPIEKIWRHYSR